MNYSMVLVKQFHKAFNHAIEDKPQLPDIKNMDFRIGFLKEELNEMIDAYNRNDLVEFVDGIADMQYVLDGLWLNSGLQTWQEKIMLEVHRSNMSKLCNSKDGAEQWIDKLTVEMDDTFHYEEINGKFLIKRSRDGKVMKGPHYFKPDLKKILDSVVV